MADKKEIMIIDERDLKEKVYVIRGQHVMLDFDLATIYGYSVSAFNQQVKRNKERFPEDFAFELTFEEMIELSKSQNVISIQMPGVKGGRAKPVKAFTEQGVYMLMTVLKGELAIEQSKALVRLFKGMKDYLIESKPLISQKSYVALIEKVEEHDRDIRQIKEMKENMVTKADLSDFMKLFDAGRDAEEILILDGQPFKADLAYHKIYRKAKKSIIVIDDYIGAKTLRHLTESKAAVQLTIISDNKVKSLRLSDYNDFCKEYPKRSITFLKTAGRTHDRYIVLDNGTKDMKVYHCGASSKDAGKRITTITELKDIEEYKDLIRALLKNPTLPLK